MKISLGRWESSFLLREQGGFLLDNPSKEGSLMDEERRELIEAVMEIDKRVLIEHLCELSNGDLRAYLRYRTATEERIDHMKEGVSPELY